jgi:tetratricopeptide (TPR) repeat protein
MQLARVLACALVLAAALGPAARPAAAAPRRTAPAKPTDAKKEKAARAHFEQAEKAFNVGKFDEALTNYQKAYEELPLPAFLFNIAQCHRNLGNNEQALFFYQRYLSLQPDAPNRKTVEDLIDEQRKRVDQAKAPAPVAQAEPPPTPAAPPSSSSPDLAARPPAPEAATGTHAVDLTASPTPEPRPRYQRYLFWGVLGAVVVGGVVTAVMVSSSGSSGSLPKGKLGTIDTR